MKPIPLRRIGIFGRTYTVMLATVVIAELLIFGMIVAFPPAAPPVTAVSTIARSLVTGRPASADVRVYESSKRPGISRGLKPAPSLAEAVRIASAGRSGSIEASMSGFGPPAPYRLQPLVLAGKVSAGAVVQGDFIVSARLSPERWRVVTSGNQFLAAIALRAFFLLMATFLVVVPFAYWLAMRTAKPFQKFAAAAERLGADPGAPQQEWSGPREIQLAGDAFNRMQRRLANYVDDRNAMLASIAHDLRTPMMRIALLVEGADRSLRAPLQQQIDEMRSMIDSVIEIVRDENDADRRERFDLASAVDTICANAEDVGATVDCHLPHEQLVVLGDRGAVQSAVRNLLDNALKYADSAEISLERRSDSAVITVSDRGPGIPDSMLDKVFEPFFRVERSRSRDTGGVGLGLTLVRRIVTGHGGTVQVRNRSGGGLEVRVTLPIATR